MQRVTMRFVRDSSDEREDDILRIFDTDCNDLFRITFRANDMKRANEFMASRSWAVQYISEILHTLIHDTDPFESIQVDTAIHPTVLYHVMDMDEGYVRQLIEDTIDSVLRRNIVKTDTQ